MSLLYQSIPMSIINRPLPSELDEGKVLKFMADIEVSNGSASPHSAADSLGPVTFLGRRRLHSH